MEETTREKEREIDRQKNGEHGVCKKRQHVENHHHHYGQGPAEPLNEIGRARINQKVGGCVT